jgi:glycerol-3-phosphate dehydrogenase subunit C
MTMRDEYPHILDLDNADVRDHIDLATRFIYRLINENGHFDVSRLPFNGRPLRVAYHTPCHLEKMGWEYYSIELLKMIPNIQLTVLQPNCCGIAGTYGFKKENYANSQKIGAPLFKEIEEGDFDFVVSDCETCKWQIEMSTSKRCEHPITVFAHALQ